MPAKQAVVKEIVLEREATSSLLDEVLERTGNPDAKLLDEVLEASKPKPQPVTKRPVTKRVACCACGRTRGCIKGVGAYNRTAEVPIDWDGFDVTTIGATVE